MKVTYRQATEKDLADIYSIELACFLRPWSYASLQNDICNNEWALYIVAEADGCIVGYCGMHTMFDEGHIMNVAVMSRFRRRGIGKGLIETVFSMTALDCYTLEVRITNLDAVSLYKHLGFEILGKRPKYYGDEDALIMWKGKTAP